MEDIKVYTVEEVAEILKMSKDYVYDRAAEGTLPCYKLGRELRFTAEHISTFLEKMVKEPAQ